MKVAVIGSGYVGLVLSACLAESGNDVISADIDEKKVTRLNAGEVPIYEPGLERLVRDNSAAGRLLFTTNAAEGIGHGALQSQPGAALLRGRDIATLALAAGGIGHGMGFIEDDHAIKVMAKPVDNLLKA